MTTQATPAQPGPSEAAILAALRIIAEWWRRERESEQEKVTV